MPLKEAEIVGAMKETKEIMVLAAKEQEQKEKVVPMEVCKSLQEFKDVMAESIGLPPLQDFQHHIDFVPDVSL